VEFKPKLILCEGKHEVNILSKLLRVDHKILDKEGKENVFRTGYTALGSNTVLIDEGGKSSLEINVLTLCSKLRSIWYEYGVNRIDVLVIIDSNHEYADSVFEDIVS